MLERGQYNEPVYYGVDQLQRTNENQLQEVEERHGEFRQLENNIVQLHEIHRDFAELVNNHGQIIDNIESSVSQTETQVVQSAISLGKAVGYQSAARRKKIICGVIVFVIIVLVVIITVVVVLTKKKS
ncbi:unnamed protein product [Rotaria sp. Silwood2]|nr:unnamed protein product [Rotaria sp. Silwood2]CAF2713962.1 unnamed protein product [Rotaria sp. Silwood2]CAF2883689.1 unnamed protein product [Rotaria sp. Silwood2]CAF3035505.1 unnamed protein product [Rotaria sp. Silwood2]CAF4162251.1 unnamed protein product [Rotaria sp. Silwood2]